MDNLPIEDEKLTLDEELNLRTTFDLDPEKQYRIVISVFKKTMFLNPVGLKEMEKEVFQKDDGMLIIENDCMKMVYKPADINWFKIPLFMNLVITAYKQGERIANSKERVNSFPNYYYYG